MLSIIVAIDENYGIGRKGDLLCYLPNDLKHFKEITSGHPVIMGRKTYMSLPRRPLLHCPTAETLLFRNMQTLPLRAQKW